MPLNPTALYDVATDLLASVVARMTTAGITLPARQYVHAGLVAYDCEQVTVTVPESGVTHAFPGEAASVNQVCAPPRHVALEVHVVRCVPIPGDSGDPPTVTELDASATEVLTDLWALAYVIWEGYREGEWGSTCSTVSLGPVTVNGPEGGFVGSVATVFLLIT